MGEDGENFSESDELAKFVADDTNQPIRMRNEVVIVDRTADGSYPPGIKEFSTEEFGICCSHKFKGYIKRDKETGVLYVPESMEHERDILDIILPPIGVRIKFSSKRDAIGVRPPWYREADTYHCTGACLGAKLPGNRRVACDYLDGILTQHGINSVCGGNVYIPKLTKNNSS